MARFYAACLASYNAGRLHGAWLRLDTDPEVMGEAIQAMLKASPAKGAEEWAVHDYDGVPSSVTIPAGESSMTFEVTAKQDDVAETDETVALCLKAAEDYRLGGYTARDAVRHGH